MKEGSLESWAAYKGVAVNVKELSLSHHNLKTILFAIYIPIMVTEINFLNSNPDKGPVMLGNAQTSTSVVLASTSCRRPLTDFGDYLAVNLSTRSYCMRGRPEVRHLGSAHM